MRMTSHEFNATCRTYKSLTKQRILAIKALDGSHDKNYIYLCICADIGYIKHCLATRSYGTRRPWLLQTLYYL